MVIIEEAITRLQAMMDVLKKAGESLGRAGDAGAVEGTSYTDGSAGILG